MSVTADKERAVVDGVPTSLYIGGEWRDTSDTLPVEDPSTGEALCEVADGQLDDAQAAQGTGHGHLRWWDRGVNESSRRTVAGRGRLAAHLTAPRPGARPCP